MQDNEQSETEQEAPAAAPEAAEVLDHAVNHHLDQIGRVAMRAVLRELAERRRALDEAFGRVREERMRELLDALEIAVPEGWQVLVSPSADSVAVTPPMGRQAG